MCLKSSLDSIDCRDLLLSLTNDKLYLVMDKDEFPEIVFKKNPEVSIKINTVEDLACAKKTVEDFFYKKNWNKNKIFDIIISVSEAVSNVLKHAQKGDMNIYYDNDSAYIFVSDRGEGIDLEDIPRLIQKGESSKSSLGMGFSIILELASAVWIHTNSNGTILRMLIEKH